MKLKQKIPQPPFGENPQAPFADDKLKRKQEIVSLTRRIEKIETPAVMALDADWGAGKTAFIKMWKAHLNLQASARAFYFNAWETDFADDPLVPFMAAIAKQLPNGNGDLVEKAQALIPIFVGGLVRKFAGSEAGQIAENAVGHMLDNYDKIAEFKRNLEEFAKAQKGQRIVIFVDELDRCRPDYAVKILERIKHLFEVPGVVFILATNRKQLRQSVKMLYGLDNNGANIYLRRFIEADFTISPPKMSDFIEARIEAMGIKDYLIDRHKNNPTSHRNWENNPELLHAELALLAKVYRYSLRDAEHLLMRIVFVLHSLKDGNHPFHPMLLAFLVMARQQMPDAYHKYIDADNNGDEMVKQWESDLKAAGIEGLTLGQILETQTNRDDGLHKDIPNAARITAHIFMAKYFARENAPGTLDRGKLIDQYEAIARSTRDTQDGAYNHHLYDAIGIMCNGQNDIDLQYLVQKIEMLDRFHFADDDDAKGKDD